jgi:hypothetical protein
LKAVVFPVCLLEKSHADIIVIYEFIWNKDYAHFICCKTTCVCVCVCVELVEIRFSSLMCAGLLSISGVLEKLEVQVSFFAIELFVLRCLVR